MKPNIVMIVADDMGYGDFGRFNEGRSRTPVLDRLIDESVCLTQHYSASAVCAPARAALFTGRYPHRTGAIDTLEGRGLDRIALRETTIGDVFKANGYATGLVGKWHSGALDPRYHPNARGFDEFVGFRGGWQDYYRWRMDVNGTFEQTDGRYLTDVLTERAINFITRHRSEPFMLHLAYNAPHFPMQAPEELVQPYLDAGFGRGVAIVYAMIEVMDRGIGRVLESLDQHGIADNTIVLFTSDNGPQFGSYKGDDTTRFNCGFNGAKGNVYEGGIRLPLVIRWPDGLEGGRDFDQMVHYTDWLPTLTAAAGINLPAALNLDGENILPVLRDEGGKVNPVRFWQWNRLTPIRTTNAAMRDGDWKLVRPVIKEAQTLPPEYIVMDEALKYEPETISDIDHSPEPVRHIPDPPPAELYNLADDPGEQNNLAQTYPERVDRMASALDRWFESVDADRRTIVEE